MDQDKDIIWSCVLTKTAIQLRVYIPMFKHLRLIIKSSNPSFLSIGSN